MAGYQVDLADVDQVVALIKSAGIKNVSSVASNVETNHGGGVWVNVTGWTMTSLNGYTLNTTLYLVVPDRDAAGDRKALLKLLNKLMTKVKPSGPVVPRTVILPDSPAQLPGLAVPFNVNCTAPVEE